MSTQNSTSAILTGKGFAHRLAALLLERGLNQVEAAQLLGMSQSLVSRYLRGATEPHRRTLEHIAACIKVPVSALTGEASSTISSVKPKTGRAPTGISETDPPPIASLMKFRNRYRGADPSLREFMSGQVRALFGPDAKKVLAWLNAR
jgi:transcriptional regulator with XRE-family HTH domain